ncbi:dTDP-4-amino-4,6-dideoxygalactose transaminase [Marinilabilia salmonicolor]|jgi:dTDP-4-amino-4,6-dideoxygalactose transaminase|uniref:DegT/DnrJ/EryC1/StrS family aminotransferase n=1 Tax=Marinilabilia salmonicolor TaxID=989 RepID=UPI000D06CD37|nr:DegT/DnrJ/EryC1/StrS family aminotransferase [Marinilabilia salmonicolor]PRY97391.1 dTDP-4-amino-4,6-dideoxygalactose transaminase [Marinilabilia salmonicolor]
MRKVPFSKVTCTGNELKYVTEVLESGWLTTAGKTLSFENKFAEKVNARYACAVNSCTAALHLGIEALGVQSGDKVFVPDMTFTASAEIVRYMGADPVFLDVEYGTSLITPEILKKAISEHPDVKYLVVVHYGGQSAEMLNTSGTGIMDICRKEGIKVLEDAAHAFPAELGGRMVGSWGDVTCFSFYANKTITTGEGGMLTTNDEMIYNRVKIMRLHGINRDVWDRFTSDKPSWEYDVVAPGFKYNMPDVNAAIGLAQLEEADRFRDERQVVAERYLEKLSDLEMVDLPVSKVPPGDHAWHLFPVVLNEKSLISRNDFIQRMADRGIGTSVHYKPMHRLSYYRDNYQLDPLNFPVAEKIWKGTVSLPIFPSMSKEEQNYVIDEVRKILYP